MNSKKVVSGQISSANCDDSTLDQWMDEFWTIYGHRDKQLSLIETWAMVAEDASRVGRGIRERKPQNGLPYLAHAFCWCTSLVKRLLTDQQLEAQFQLARHHSLGIVKFADILWFKYPGICPRCLDTVCRCPSLVNAKPAQVRRRALLKAREQRRRPSTIRAWQEMFYAMYGPAHSSKSLGEIGFHYQEEIGEVFRALRRLRTVQPEKGTRKIGLLQENLIEEIADVVSWTFSIVQKYAAQAQDLELYSKRAGLLSGDFLLSRVLWSSYGFEPINGLVCPACKKRKCGPMCDSSSLK